MPSTDNWAGAVGLPATTKLPPARTAPLTDADPAWAGLPADVRGLIDRLQADATPVLVLQTGTRVDAGAWLRRPRAWLACYPRHLAVLAPGPRPLAQVVAMSDLQASQYNHITAELILSPAEDVRYQTFRLTPLDGYQVLSQIYHEDQSNA